MQSLYRERIFPDSILPFPVGSGVPTVTGISPTYGPNEGGTNVTIMGTGFTGATAVSFGPNPALSFNVTSDTSITATSPANATVGAIVNVRVTTPDGKSAKTPAGAFAYGAPPAVSGISPPSGTTAGGTSVTINGTGFTNAGGVSFGPNPALSFNVTSDTSITATSPAWTGTVDVTVITPIGTSATSPNDQFMYTGGGTGGGSGAPTAGFTGTPTSGIAPLDVTFTDQSTGSPSGWAWYFGDENYSAPWTNLTSNAGWLERFQHASVALPDGNIVLMGGYDDLGDTYKRRMAVNRRRRDLDGSEREFSRVEGAVQSQRRGTAGRSYRPDGGSSVTATGAFR